MILCDAGRTLNMLSIPIALALGRLGVQQLYLVALVEGILFVFFNIAERAALPRVVAPEDLPAATGQSEMTWGLSALTGPPLGGILYGLGTYALPFLTDAVSYAASVVSLLFIRTDFQAERTPRTATLLAEMGEAFNWLRKQPLLRFLVLTGAAGDFLFASIGLIPIVIARQQMHARPLAIGFIFTLAAIGGIVGSLLATRIRERLRFGPTVITTGWLLAILYPALAIAPMPFALGIVRLLMSGTVAVFNTARFSYQLAAIPDALQGRVNSLTNLIAFGSLPIGLALAGISLQDIGKTATILAIAGCLALLALVTTQNRWVREQA